MSNIQNDASKLGTDAKSLWRDLLSFAVRYGIAVAVGAVGLLIIQHL